MTVIEDQELREIFRQESEEHLNGLEQGLLHLEKQPTDQAVLNEVLREAHSLKGAARMLGLSDIELLAHRLESQFREITKSQRSMPTEQISQCLSSVDALRESCLVAVGDEDSVRRKRQPGTKSTPAQRDILRPEDPPKNNSATGRELVQEVNHPEKSQRSAAASTASSPGNTSLSTEPSGSTSDLIPVESSSASTATEPTEIFEKAITSPMSGSQTNPDQQTIQDVESQAIARTEQYRIETVRVEPERLDALMTHAGELIVSQERVGARLHDVERLITLWETVAKGLERVGYRLLGSKNSEEDRGLAEHLDRLMDEFNITREQMKDIDTLLRRIRTDLTNDSTRLRSVSSTLDDGIRAIRLLPLATVFQQFERMSRDIALALGKDVELIIEGGDVHADKRILEEIKDPLMHLIRNAIHHGIESPEERRKVGKPPKGIIHLRGLRTSLNIQITLSDDGRGLDTEKIIQRAIKMGILSRQVATEQLTEDLVHSLIFTSGLSTQKMITDISGRGIGMDVVKSNIEGLKGRVNITSTPGEGCVFTLDLPQTLATTRIILIRIDTQFFGVPVEFVHSNGWVNIDELYTLEGTTSITLEGQPTSVARAAHILEMTNVKNYRQGEVIASIVIRDGNEKLLLLVDEVIDEQELVIKPTGTLLRRVRNISGAGILGTGEVCMVLNPPDMLRDARRCILAKQDTSATHMMAERPWIETEREENRRAVVLLAEDSAITRAQERRILQGAGYEVIMAVDGREAWEKLQQHEVDAVVSDIMMPGMNGFELTQSIRASHQYDDLPVILVTTLSSNEDKRKGMESGADAYITKASFEQKKLLDTLARLLGYE